MKKNFFYALMSAIALTGAIGFTACSSDSDAVVENNPTYDGESVKTQFTISFPQNVAKSTRMTGDVVQVAQSIETFRGMDNIKLIPFGINQTIASTNTRIGSPIKLATQILPTEKNTVNNSIAAADLMSNNNSVLYSDVDIPVGTGAFLFYGKAIDNNANAAITSIPDKFKFGTLTPSDALSSASTGAPTDITFTPVGIKEKVSETGTADDIADYLTIIANTEGWSETTNDGLKELYTNFIKLKAGSSQAAADVIGDLLWSIRNNTSGLANAIRASIYHGHDIANNGDIDCDKGYISNIDPETYAVTLGTKCSGYPANNNLPEGAAQITWQSQSNKFVVTSSNIPTATSTDMNVASLSSYVYPANLQYYVNSPAVVSTSSQKANYVTTKSWEEIIAGYNSGAAGYVGASTRSVAIKNPIQYGVGQLKMTVKASSAALVDNSDLLPENSGTGVNVTVPDAGFPVTGILIGGQRVVDWEFLPSGSTLYTIYDNILQSHGAANAAASPILASTSFSSPNYTLALETPVGESVYVALELVNNTGKAFYGDGNEKILPGRTFYLVGELNPEINTGETAKKYASDHKTYQLSGTSLSADKVTMNEGDPIQQVFVQDYVTELKLTISNLRKAMSTIPDLRMPQMEFGLSVDLNWQPGIVFEVNL